MNTNKETSINQLLNLYEQNDLTGFTTLLNSEEINVNKTQQRNLLSLSLHLNKNMIMI